MVKKKKFKDEFKDFRNDNKLSFKTFKIPLKTTTNVEKLTDKNNTVELLHYYNASQIGNWADINALNQSIFENNTAQNNMKEFETQVNNILNKATEISGNKGRKSLSANNRFVMIVASGSKGTALNISQMISCLGQQNVDAKRIPYGFDSRTLPIMFPFFSVLPAVEMVGFPK